MRWLIVMIGISTAGLGCGSKDTNLVSKLRMVDNDLGSGPWQIVTWKGDKVTRDSTVLDGDKIVVRSASVYINEKSQFILRDGTPIEIFTGDKIYWNSTGEIITSKLQVVPEYIVFSVNGKPMDKATAMTLKDYSSVRDEDF